VFVKADGTSMHPDIFSQLFDRTVAKIDVPSISLHDLRHTHATLLLKAGVNVKVVSERLGHANIAFTMHVYQHVLPGHAGRATRNKPTRSRLAAAQVAERNMYRRSDRLLVLLHIFAKRTAKIPASDITIADDRWADFKARMDADPRRPPRAAGHDAP
jgi:hypothetical protein